MATPDTVISEETVSDCSRSHVSKRLHSGYSSRTDGATENPMILVDLSQPCYRCSGGNSAPRSSSYFCCCQQEEEDRASQGLIQIKSWNDYSPRSVPLIAPRSLSY